MVKITFDSDFQKGCVTLLKEHAESFLKNLSIWHIKMAEKDDHLVVLTEKIS